VWPPGSADTVCPRPPLMIQVHNFVFRIKKRQRWDVETMWTYDLDLWFLEVTAIVGHTRIGTLSEYQVYVDVVWPTLVRHTMWPWPLTLEVMALTADAGLRPPSAHQLWSSYISLTVRKIWHNLYVCVSRRETLTFDLFTLKQVHNVAQVPSCQFRRYYDYLFTTYGPLVQHGSEWLCDLDLWRHGASGSIRIPSSKFVGLAIRKIWRTMCVSINGPGDPNLWPFDLETGMLVASKVGNLPSKFGHARPLGSRIIRCVRDGRTDGRTDKSNAYCPLPYGRGIIMMKRALYGGGLPGRMRPITAGHSL